MELDLRQHPPPQGGALKVKLSIGIMAPRHAGATRRTLTEVSQIQRLYLSKVLRWLAATPANKLHADCALSPSVAAICADRLLLGVCFVSALWVCFPHRIAK